MAYLVSFQFFYTNVSRLHVFYQSGHDEIYILTFVFIRAQHVKDRQQLIWPILARSQYIED